MGKQSSVHALFISMALLIVSIVCTILFFCNVLSSSDNANLPTILSFSGASTFMVSALFFFTYLQERRNEREKESELPPIE